MMDKTMFQDQTPEERKLLLESNCLRVEERSYQREFTPHELEVMRFDLAEACIEINKIEQEKKDFASECKMRLEPHKKVQAELLGKIETRHEDVKEECYGIPYFEERQMAYYNKHGVLIDSRPLRTTEMQRPLFADMSKSTFQRTGTED